MTVGTRDVMLLREIAGTVSIIVAFEIIVKESVVVISGGDPWVPLILSADVVLALPVLAGTDGITIVKCWVVPLMKL